MAYIDVVINSSGTPVERYFETNDPNFQPGDYGVMQRPDAAVGTYGATGLVDYGPAAQVSYSMVDEPVGFELPPEVAQLLGPGVNPFASVTPAWGPVSTNPVAVVSPTVAVPAAGTGGLIGIGGLVPPVSVSPLNVVAAPGAIQVDMWMGGTIDQLPELLDRMGIGEVYQHRIHNRMVSGVRMGGTEVGMIVMGGDY